MNIFERLESQVRIYSRMFPAVISKAKNEFLYDEQGNEYIDFFAGAGTINYGHNNPKINDAIIEYIRHDGILHSLDKFTTAKKTFLENFESIIIKPRNLQYKVQFCGPTGTNSVEAAFKLARKVKRRRGIVSFTNAFHGLTRGALAATGNRQYKNELFVDNTDVVFMPYDGYFGSDVNTAQYLRKFLADKCSGVSIPAALILETIQAEGGVNVATVEWLREIDGICKEFDILLIVDEIQVGGGRSGDYFSFERAGIEPDIVTLSKAIGGGMPLSIVLMKPELDVWEPGEHTGTFRGNNLAFIAGSKVLEYWKSPEFSISIKEKSKILVELLGIMRSRYERLITEIKGYGFIFGIVIPEKDICRKISREAFKRGLIVELAGENSEVLKLLPPLTIEEKNLRKGVALIEQSIENVVKNLNGLPR